MDKIEITKPKTIREAIDELETFFICDMWYACKSEWKEEKDMIKYLDAHFGVFREQMLSLIKPEANK